MMKTNHAAFLPSQFQAQVRQELGEVGGFILDESLEL